MSTLEALIAHITTKLTMFELMLSIDTEHAIEAQNYCAILLDALDAIARLSSVANKRREIAALNETYRLYSAMLVELMIKQAKENRQ